MAKTRDITTIMVGHVTKDGSIAGPRVLEHVVDVVLHFEGDRNSRFRMVRALKNRFGPVDEVGCFDLGADGITAVTDPTGLFVENHESRVPGTCVAVTMEGRRPMLAEVQALVTRSALERPRRTTSGLDSARVAMVLAVLQQHCGVALHSQRRLRLDRRRRPARPSRPPTWRSRSRSRPRAPAAPHRAAWWRSARSAWPARCARCATSPSASPRPPGSASGSPWCRPPAATARGERRTVDGMTVLEAGDLPVRTAGPRAARRRADRESHPLD